MLEVSLEGRSQEVPAFVKVAQELAGEGGAIMIVEAGSKKEVKGGQLKDGPRKVNMTSQTFMIHVMIAVVKSISHANDIRLRRVWYFSIPRLAAADGQSDCCQRLRGCGRARGDC